MGRPRFATSRREAERGGESESEEVRRRSMAGRQQHPIPAPNATIAEPRVLQRFSHAQPSAQGLEDRIAIQHREIQTLLVDNQRIAATHVALKQELAAAQHDLRALSASSATSKAERDAHVRELYDRSRTMEAELRGLDAMAADLAQVRADVHKLSAARNDVAADLQALEDDLARARLDSKPVPAIKAEIETLNREIQRGRAAIEQEKKTHAHNSEHRQAMEKYLVSMAREIDKLHAELANSERRARAAAAAALANPNPGYGAISGNSDMVYGGQLYPDPYSMHQVRSVAESNPQYGTGTLPHGHGSVDMQQTNIHR